MIPVTPELAIRPVERDDQPAVLGLINRWLSTAIYSLPLDVAALHSQLLADAPPTHFEVHWSAHQRLGAWRAGDLLGFVDLAAGHDQAGLAASAQPPEGLLRFAAVIDNDESASAAFVALMGKAEAWWRNQGATHAFAFHIATGYPSFQAGGGLLPGEWSQIVRLLTAQDWRFSRRYYALVRPMGAPVEEENPQADLSLVQQRIPDGRIYRVYHRRVEPVARARIAGMTLDRPGTAQRVAHLVNLEVEPLWRNHRLGKWLLRRVLNDATLQGFQETIAFVSMNLPIALNLLVQHGFQEINYRGYTFEKNLAT